MGIDGPRVGRRPALALDGRGNHDAALVASALAEGCSRVEGSLWALIGEAWGVLPAGEPAFRARIRRYVDERRTGRASAATLLGMLRSARAHRPSEALRAEIAAAIDATEADWFD